MHAAVVAIALLALFVRFSDAYGIAPDSAAQVIASAREYSGVALLVVGVCGAVDVKAGRQPLHMGIKPKSLAKSRLSGHHYSKASAKVRIDRLGCSVIRLGHTYCGTIAQLVRAPAF